jgi:tetratricopeptide (TPR) repeat protein
LRAILEKLGEAGVPDDKISARLNAAADQLISLRTQLARLPNKQSASIRDQALAHIDRGEFDAARAALARGRKAARTNEAEFLAVEAGIDHLNLAYREAAKKYAEAANLVEAFDRDARWQYLMKQAGALYHHGNEFGDNEALVEAIGVYRDALKERIRDRVPLDWATTQNNLGIALEVLGEREGGTARLEEAVTAYRAALQEQKRERVPLDWAASQLNLGTALLKLGARESGPTRLEEAVIGWDKTSPHPTAARIQ